MKGKRRNFIAVFALILSLVAVVALSACSDDKENYENVKTYLSDAVVTDSGFSAKLEISDAEFVTTDKSAFVLYATEVDEETGEVKSVSLDNFTISKTDNASVLNIEFEDENAAEHGGSWKLVSNKAVTSVGEYVTFSIFAGSSSFSFSCSTSDFSSLSEKVVVDCELYGATLKEGFSASDIELGGVLEGKPFSLNKISAEEFSLDFGNPFTDTTDGYAYITLKASAVNTLYPVDSTVSLTFENIYAETVFDEITVEGDTAVVPLKTDFGLFEGIVKEDITLVHSDFDNTPVADVTVENVVFEDNRLTVTFKGSDIASKLNNTVICFNNKNALNKEMAVGIGELSSFLTSSVTIRKSNDALTGYSVKISVNNGSFNGLTASDISVAAKGADFEINSIDTDSFVIEFATTLENLDVSVSIPAAKAINDFGISEDIVLDFKCNGSEPVKGEFLSSIGMGIVKGIGGQIGSVIGGKIYDKVLKPILVDMGIAEEDPLDKIQENLETLQKSVNTLSYRMEKLSQQITAAVADIKNYIDMAQYQTTLLNYNSYFNKINLFNLQNYGDKDGLAKVMLFREQYRNADGIVEVPEDKKAEYDAAMNKFVNYVSTVGDWTAIIADIKTFGENMVAASAGVNGGYLEAYWKYMETFYPYDTLTIDPKTAFLDGSIGNYTLAVNAVLIYCDYTGSTAVAQTLIESYKNVYDKALTYDQNIADIKNNLQNGRIFDYVNGRYYSAQTQLYGAHAEGDKIVQGSHDFEEHAIIKNIETIIKKCHDMDMDLITAWKKAGFIGLEASKNGSYRIKIHYTRNGERKSSPYKWGLLNTYFIEEFTYIKANLLVYRPTDRTYSFSQDTIYTQKRSYVPLINKLAKYSFNIYHNAHEAFNMFK